MPLLRSQGGNGLLNSANGANGVGRQAMNGAGTGFNSGGLSGNVFRGNQGNGGLSGMGNGAGGLGGLSSSDALMQLKQSVAAGMGGGVGMGMLSGGGEMGLVRQEMELIKQAVNGLEADRDNLRQAIRKLKVENSRLKLRLRRVGRAAGCLEGLDDEGRAALDCDEIDYEAVRDFILIGGPKDPFALRFEAPVKDVNGKEHASAERYVWYKMAETFGDTGAMEAIHGAETGQKAEEAMQKITNFDEAAWGLVKMKHWEEGQKLKMEQHAWIKNLLVHSDKVYIAISSQDKLWGTGWRKQRAEAGQPRLWDGENEGGRALMRMRDAYKEGHVWADDKDKDEARRKFDDLKRTFWRRPLKRDGDDFQGANNNNNFGNRQMGAGNQRGGQRGGQRGRGGPRGRGQGDNKRGRF